MEKIAVIFAGGAGQRMGSEKPKQFLKIYGKEIIIHTIELFENNPTIDKIYVVCIEDWIPYLKKLLRKHEIEKVQRIIPGGATGQDSIFLGLRAAKRDYEDAIVLIHDGVRPLVTEETIEKCIKTVEKYGNAITVTQCFETPIKSENGTTVKEMPARKVMYTAQAPQCFHLDQIYNIHLEERKVNPEYNGIVDSCGLMFKHGFECHIVEGNRGNIKVTTPDDFCTLLGNYNARDYEQILAIDK